MRRQKSMTASPEKVGTRPKLKRVKTMLPLEAIPEHAKLHGLVYVAAANISSLGNALMVLANYDQYSKSGNQALGFSGPPSDLPKIERSLEGLLKRWVQDVEGTGGEKGDVFLNLSGLQEKSLGAI
jgi:hypothetical protein